jgi:hypothetical protein
MNAGETNATDSVNTNAIVESRTRLIEFFAVLGFISYSLV